MGIEKKYIIDENTIDNILECFVEVSKNMKNIKCDADKDKCIDAIDTNIRNFKQIIFSANRKIFFEESNIKNK
jgi:hypothetical protein